MDALEIVKNIASVTVNPPSPSEDGRIGDASSSSSDSDSDVDYSLPTIPIRSLDDAALPAVSLETGQSAPQVTIRRNSHCPKVIEAFSKTGKRWFCIGFDEKLIVSNFVCARSSKIFTPVITRESRAPRGRS